MAPSATTTQGEITRGMVLDKDDRSVTLGVVDTEYRIRLAVYQPVAVAIGKSIRGTIRAQAKRLDRSGKGGRYIEPVYGRPRRIQGHIIGVNESERTVTINATVPIVCKTDSLQRVSEFAIGDFVTCGLEDGASFISTS